MAPIPLIELFHAWKMERFDTKKLRHQLTTFLIHLQSMQDSNKLTPPFKQSRVSFTRANIVLVLKHAKIGINWT